MLLLTDRLLASLSRPLCCAVLYICVGDTISQSPGGRGEEEALLSNQGVAGNEGDDEGMSTADGKIQKEVSNPRKTLRG